jgi:hypothetical protein
MFVDAAPQRAVGRRRLALWPGLRARLLHAHLSARLFYLANKHPIWRVRMPCLAPWRCREASPSQHRLLGHHQSQERTPPRQLLRPSTAGIYRTDRGNSRMDRRRVVRRRVARTVAQRRPVLPERRSRGTPCGYECSRTAPSGNLIRNRRAPA